MERKIITILLAISCMGCNVRNYMFTTRDINISLASIMENPLDKPDYSWQVEDTIRYKTYKQCICHLRAFDDSQNMFNKIDSHKLSITIVNDSIGYLTFPIGSYNYKIITDNINFKYKREDIDKHGAKLPSFFKIEFDKIKFPEFLQRFNLNGKSDNNWWIIGPTEYNKLQLIYHSSTPSERQVACFCDD